MDRQECLSYFKKRMKLVLALNYSDAYQLQNEK